MAIIRNDKDLYLQQSPLRLRTMPLPDSVTIDFGAVKGTDDLVNTANLALETANKINGKIADIASDNKLTLDEKSALKGTWDSIYKERDSVVQTASTLFVNSSAYQSSYNSLYNYLQPLLGLNASNTFFNNGSTVSNINGNQLRQTVATYFSERQKIINSASIAASKKADWSNIANDNNLKPQDGADKTSANISAGFANQGNLAIKDSVGYNDVSGTKPPIDADKTSSNIAAGFTNQGALAVKNSVGYIDVSGTKPPIDADKTSSNTAQGITGQGALATRNNVTASHINVPALTSAGNLSANAVNANTISTGAMTAIVAEVGTLTVGDIIGTNSIDITGRAVFNGSYGIGSESASLHANNLLGTDIGVLGHTSSASGYGVMGFGHGISTGVYGVSQQAIGVLGASNGVNSIGGKFTSSDGVGVTCGSATGIALKVVGSSLFTGHADFSGANITANKFIGALTGNSTSSNKVNTPSGKPSGVQGSFTSTNFNANASQLKYVWANIGGVSRKVLVLNT